MSIRDIGIDRKLRWTGFVQKRASWFRGFIARKRTFRIALAKFVVSKNRGWRLNAIAMEQTGAARRLFFFIMAVAAAEVAVGFAILTMIYRNTRSSDIDILNKLKW